MTSNIELLPCPFCGSTDIGDDHVTTYSVDSSYDVFGCRSCGARFENGSETEWNRRAQQPAAVDGARVALAAANLLAILYPKRARPAGPDRDAINELHSALEAQQGDKK